MFLCLIFGKLRGADSRKKPFLRNNIQKNDLELHYQRWRRLIYSMIYSCLFRSKTTSQILKIRYTAFPFLTPSQLCNQVLSQHRTVSIWSNQHSEGSFPQGAAYPHWSFFQAHFQTACCPNPGLDLLNANRISFLTLKLLIHFGLRSSQDKFWVTKAHPSRAVLGQCLRSFGEWNTNTVIASSSCCCSTTLLCQLLTQSKIFLPVLQSCLMSDESW